ncbi:unnamed protein product [Peronospora farinosa]|uniref:Polyprotein n=1 Tax=Peronospora farinosa TaxID=134698 RepID=A0AAV0UQ95_9STRA|nr:unnamed protein product [Peronospora farinosa]
MLMTLSRMGMLAHIQMVKPEAGMTKLWVINDTKALELIAHGIAVEHHNNIWSATTATQAWITLHKFYNRTTMNNRVTMTCRLHELKMDDSVTMTQYLDKFDELIIGLQSLGEPVDMARQLVILFSSLSAEYEIIASIEDNAKVVTLIEVKEKLLKEYERQDKKEATERVLKATPHGVKLKNTRFYNGGRNNGRKYNVSRKRSGFKGKCFNCDKFGHISRTAWT